MMYPKTAIKPIYSNTTKVVISMHNPRLDIAEYFMVEFVEQPSKCKDKLNVLFRAIVLIVNELSLSRVFQNIDNI